MELTSYTASAPATFMIAGEHAVLHGQPALVGAIAKRLYVTLKPSTEDTINIFSDRLGHYKTSRSSITVQHPFHFVLGVLRRYKNQLPSGCTIQIDSEFSHQVGFGSSAAITVATLHVLSQWLNLSLSQESLFTEGRKLIQKIQGLGSGADVAASVYGGVVYYNKDPVVIDVLPTFSPVNLIYIGYKTPTAEVVNLVERNRQANPIYFEELFKKMGDCTESCREAIKKRDWYLLGELFVRHQQFQKELGVSTDEIDEILSTVNKLNGIQGSKISGSGLGDCILCLGDLPSGYFPRNKRQQVNGVRQFDINITSAGVSAHPCPEKWVIYG